MTTKFLERPGKSRLAYKKFEPGGENPLWPTVMFCPGFRSDMEGTKALFLEQLCEKRGQPYIRFDYSGHGASGGQFEDGTIGSWTEDTLAILDEATQGPVLLIGSSMGGWIALLAAQARPERVKGLIGIAAAPDFTREIYDQLGAQQQADLRAQGYIDLPGEYSDIPYRITYQLIQDGEDHCLLDKKIKLNIPLRLIQGMQDTDVPWQKAYRIKNALADEDRADVILIESADHRLSRPEDLELIGKQVTELSEMIISGDT